MNTASTPSIASAALVSIERDAAVRDVAALEREVLHADDLDVVDVGAAALDQARVLAALDALADELRQDGSAWPWSTSLPRGVLNGVDDVLVAGAAAEVAGDALADLAARSACGLSFSRLTADMIMPGVQ